MIVHGYRGPGEHIAAPSVPAPQECPYCHRAHAIQPSGECRFCGVWVPREWKRPRSGQKPATASRAEYWPRHDGEIDHGPQAIRYPGERLADDPGDELAEYQALLDACHDPRADELEDPCDPANWKGEQGDLDNSPQVDQGDTGTPW